MTNTNELSKKFLKKSLNNIVDKLKRQGFDGQPKISIYDINTGISLDINGDSPGWAASIIKFPIMIAAMNEVSKGNLKLEEKLAIDHKFRLELDDTISNIPNGELVSLPELMCEMIVNSDNEATNMIANRIGVETINNFMWNIDMNKTMLGHLLCPNVPRYTSEFNKDGSNITTPNDMVKSLRQVYDLKTSKLDDKTRILSDYFFKYTQRDGIKFKIGYISDIEYGDDVHEVGIIDDRIIYAIMINKVGQKEIKRYNRLYQKRKQEPIFQRPVVDYDEIYASEMYYTKTRFFEQEIRLLIPDKETGDATINPDIITPYRALFPARDRIITDINNTPITIDRPYNFDKLPKPEDKKRNKTTDLLSNILRSKGNYLHEYTEFIPTPREVHHMVKNVLINYLYL